MIKIFEKKRIRDYFANGFQEIETHDQRVETVSLSYEYFKLLCEMLDEEVDICANEKFIEQGIFGHLWGATLKRIDTEQIIFQGGVHMYSPEPFVKRTSKYKWMQLDVKEIYSRRNKKLC